MELEMLPLTVGLRAHYRCMVVINTVHWRVSGSKGNALPTEILRGCCGQLSCTSLGAE